MLWCMKYNGILHIDNINWSIIFQIMYRKNWPNHICNPNCNREPLANNVHLNAFTCFVKIWEFEFCLYSQRSTLHRKVTMTRIILALHVANTTGWHIAMIWPFLFLCCMEDIPNAVLLSHSDMGYYHDVSANRILWCTVDSDGFMGFYRRSSRILVVYLV